MIELLQLSQKKNANGKVNAKSSSDDSRLKFKIAANAN